MTRLGRRNDDATPTFNQLLQTRTHHMYILDAEKLKFYVLIKCFIFVPFASRTICHRINSRTSVHHVHESIIWICVPNRLQHLLVLQTACTETGQRLTASTDRCQIGMQIREHRQASLRTEPRTANQHSCCCLGRYINLSWIWWTKLQIEKDVMREQCDADGIDTHRYRIIRKPCSDCTMSICHSARVDVWIQHPI